MVDKNSVCLNDVMELYTAGQHAGRFMGLEWAPMHQQPLHTSCLQHVGKLMHLVPSVPMSLHVCTGKG